MIQVFLSRVLILFRYSFLDSLTLLINRLGCFYESFTKFIEGKCDDTDNIEKFFRALFHRFLLRENLRNKYYDALRRK